MIDGAMAGSLRQHVLSHIPAFRSSLLAATLLGPAAAASAGVPWQQATSMTFGWAAFEPSVSGDGRFVAFRSAFNFVGENADVNFEIFLFDRDTGSFTQVSHTPGNFGNFEPKITPDGSAIVFRSLYNFVGTNSDGSFELFEYTVATGAIKQLTFTPGAAILSSPRMSADGAYLVFLSSDDGTMDVKRYNRLTGVTTAVTNLPFGCIVSHPSVNGDGSVVAFRSNHNINGENPNASYEIWRWQEGQGSHVVTNTIQQNELPAIDGSGRFIAFISRANLAGENPGATREIFVADTLRGTFEQITPSYSIGKHLEPVFAPDGSSILFESERDIVGLNPDKNRELFRYIVATGVIEQETVTTGGVSINGLSEQAAANYVSISTDGMHLAYRNEHVLDPRADDPAPEVNLEVFVGSLPAKPLFADLNNDGAVGEADLAICLGAWATADPYADLNHDGTVDLVDLSLLLGAWTAP